MIAQLLASATDGQRVDLTTVVMMCGSQTTCKTGTLKRVAVLADPTGHIELTMLGDGSVQSAHLARGDIVTAKNAKVGVWNGKMTLLMFTAPTIASDEALKVWWMETHQNTTPATVQTILTLADQEVAYNVTGLVVSTEDASSTKSGGTKRKFTLADASTPNTIDVCFVGNRSVAQPNYVVGSVVTIPSAKVGIWQGTRSLLIFEPPMCGGLANAAVAVIHEWVRAGGAAIHGPVSLEKMRDTDDDQRVDLLPVVVSVVHERTMTAGSLWKRNIDVVDNTIDRDGVQICAVGAAAEMDFHIGDVLQIKRAKVCSFGGKRGALVFDAPSRVSATDCVQMTTWLEAKKESILMNAAADGEPGQPTLRRIPMMEEGTRVCFQAVVVINERLIADCTGYTLDVSFVTSPPGRFIRIHHAKVSKGGLEVTAFTCISDAALEAWWAMNEHTNLTSAKDATAPPVSEWPF